MDLRHLTAGSTLYLPVAVEGALLSVGDTHACQGDGEICGTGVECSSVVVLRTELIHQRALAFPVVETDGRSARQGPFLATTGIGPDLMEAACGAARGMIDQVVRRTALDAVDAYLLCSLAGDLTICEVVDAPNWVVSMNLALDLLR